MFKYLSAYFRIFGTKIVDTFTVTVIFAQKKESRANFLHVCCYQKE